MKKSSFLCVMNISQIIVVCLSFSLCFGAEVKKRNYAVIGIKNAEGVSVGETDIIADRLRGELFNTGRVGMMEREQMQQILKEQGFQQSGACTDEACMVEIGQLLGVERLISGSIGKLGSIFLVNLRSIDVQTAKIIAVVSVDIKGGIEDVVQYLPNIAQQLVAETGTAPAPVAEKPGPPAVKDTVSKPPEPQKEVVAVDTTPKKPETLVIDNTRKEKNKNRAGIRINANFFPGEMVLYKDSLLKGNFTETYPQPNKKQADKLKKDPRYFGVDYNRANMNMAIEFMIKTGRFLTINVGPGFMFSKMEFIYNYLRTTLTDTTVMSNWHIYIFSPHVTTGLNFVARIFPLKINAGVVVDLNFNILTNRWKYDWVDRWTGRIINSYLYKTSDFKVNASFGPRVGVEILSGPHVGFNVDFIYRYNRITAKSIDLDDDQSHWQFKLPGIAIGAGVNFYFK